MLDEFNPALRVAKFLDGQLDLWQRHLPNAFGQGHWHIIGYVRPYGTEGVSLKKVFHHVAGIFGMDSSTCNKRLKELFAEGLLSADEEPLKRTTQILGTSKLIERYDAYSVDLANLMIATAVESSPKPMVTGVGGASLNERVNGFYERLASLSDRKMDQFLRSTISSPLVREKALHCLQTYTYWRIISMSWQDRSEGSNCLLVDDFHMRIYPITRKGVNSTKECLQDLIHWGFLERLNQSHGVKANRFAVRITEPAYDLFLSTFEQAHQVLVAIAQDIITRFSLGETQESTVVPITRSVNRNVSTTSLDGSAAISVQSQSASTSSS